MNRSVIGWLALMSLIIGATAIVLAVKYRREQAMSGHGVPEIDTEYLKLPESSREKWLREFTLTERSGRRVGTADLKGKVHVVNFFFSTCPGPCLSQNRKFEELHAAYAPKGLQFLSITCDPENDTPSALRDYASRRFPTAGNTWWFLTGDLLYIRRIAAEMYEVGLDKQTHTERFIVVDKWGTVRGTFHWNQPDEIFDMRRLLDKLLAETEPPPKATDDGAGAPTASIQTEE